MGFSHVLYHQGDEVQAAFLALKSLVDNVRAFATVAVFIK